MPTFNLSKVVGVVALLLTGFAGGVQAVEVSGGYDTTAPNDSTVPGWDAGWNGPGVTGWNYVGTVNGASGVYLGDGFVLTAGHVGAGDFMLDGDTYDLVAGSGTNIGGADLTLFQISSSPSLPALTLALDPPTAHGATKGSSIVMIGYGGGQGESWGENNVTRIDYPVALPETNPTFNSLDIVTDDGTFGTGNRAITNNAQLVAGDSGGGDFIFNATTSKWELAGINEVEFTASATDSTPVASGMVQLSNYDALIEADIAAVPEPSTWLMSGLGLIFLAGMARIRRTLAA